MSWNQAFTDNPFLIFSIACGSAALALILYTILNSGQHAKTAGPIVNEHYAIESKNWRRSVLDKITLLNKNFIQCPECFKIDLVNIRFCSRCGMRLVPHAELSGNDLQTNYVAPDSSTRRVGITLEPDARTKMGVIIGIQDTESPKMRNGGSSDSDLYARNIDGTWRTMIQVKSDRTEGIRSPKKEMVATGLREDRCDDACHAL
jgi:hypothetical protein